MWLLLWNRLLGADVMLLMFPSLEIVSSVSRWLIRRLVLCLLIAVSFLVQSSSAIFIFGTTVVRNGSTNSICGKSALMRSGLWCALKKKSSTWFQRHDVQA